MHIITKIKVTNPRLTRIDCKVKLIYSITQFYQVVVGDHDITKSDGEQRITPKYEPAVQFIILPNVSIISSFRAFHDNDFSFSRVDRDLAIIELSSAVRFSDHVSPICLPDKEKSYDAELVTVAGWGKLGTSQGQPRILQKVYIRSTKVGSRDRRCFVSRLI